MQKLDKIYVGKSQLAKRLNVSRKTIYNQRLDKKIRSFQLGSRRAYTESAILTFIERGAK